MAWYAAASVLQKELHSIMMPSSGKEEVYFRSTLYFKLAEWAEA